MFRDIQPDTILVKRVLVRVETLQIPAAFCLLLAIVHRRILLMAKNNALAGPTFSATFATLGADWFLFVT